MADDERSNTYAHKTWRRRAKEDKKHNAEKTPRRRFFFPSFFYAFSIGQSWCYEAKEPLANIIIIVIHISWSLFDMQATTVVLANFIADARGILWGRGKKEENLKECGQQEKREPDELSITKATLSPLREEQKGKGKKDFYTYEPPAGGRKKNVYNFIYISFFLLLLVLPLVPCRTALKMHSSLNHKAPPQIHQKK